MAMDEEAPSGLTIKISNSCNKPGKEISMSVALSSDLPSLILHKSVESSSYNSASFVSPPSSAFVSALQSPYISPRALTSKLQEQPKTPSKNPTPATHPSPPVSQSDDIPSSSYTPPSDQYGYSDHQADTRPKFVTCVPVQDPAPPRISFSFPVPRISFTKVPISPASNAKLRSCDVFIGFHGRNPNLVRFCKWLKSELELQGIACFVADRAKYSYSQSHEITDRVICSMTYGMIVVSNCSFLNHLSMEEIRFFAQKKNLIPLLFGTGPNDIISLLDCSSISKDCRAAVDGLIKCDEYKLEANEDNWRSCVTKASGILRAKLGRKSVAEKDVEGFEELPFPRNKFFVGREKEIMEIESAFFGFGDCPEQNYPLPTIKDEVRGQSEGLADEESELSIATSGGRYINLELRKCKEPNLEAWVEPVVGRNSLKRLKYKKSKSGNYKNLSSNSVICITGIAGIGKTELALEYAYRYSQRYKMVLWVGGEAGYFRQNILNLLLNLGLDVSANAERERGRIRSFEEQEIEGFKRVKKELFRETPYLLIIDNLEIEKEWWEGKDLHDLIPRNTGGSHVIITTRLTKVMNSDIMQLPPLPLSDAMVLMRGRRKSPLLNFVIVAVLRAEPIFFALLSPLGFCCYAGTVAFGGILNLKLWNE